jgi:hypothetical protein
MPFPIVEFVRRHRAASVRIAGLILFLIAFALPAVRVGKHADMFSPTFAGYECARIASTGIYELARWPFVAHNAEVRLVDDGMDFKNTFLLALSGLINPLVVAQFLSFAQKRRRVGLSMGALTVVGMIATWTLFTRMGIFPLIGHVLWIVGAAIIVGAGFVKEAETQS